MQRQASFVSCVLTFCCLSVAVAAEPLPTVENFPPRSPDDSLRSFVPRPGFTVELVAAEPLVADPVGIAWDGKALWIADGKTGKLFKVSPPGGF